MSLANEFHMLLISDLSNAGVDQLTSKFGLWMRNNIIHFFFGVVIFVIPIYWPARRTATQIAVACFVVFQFAQLIFSHGSAVDILSDGAFDLIVFCAGWAMAFWVAMQEPKGVQRD